MTWQRQQHSNCPKSLHVSCEPKTRQEVASEWGPPFWGTLCYVYCQSHDAPTSQLTKVVVLQGGTHVPRDLGSSYVLVYVTKHVQEVMSKRGVLGHVVL